MGIPDRDGTRDDVRDGTREDVRTDVRTKRTHAHHVDAANPKEQPRAEGEELKPNGQANGDTEIDRLAAELGWNSGRVLKFARMNLGMKEVASADWTKLLDSDAEKLAAAMRKESRS